MWQWLNMWGKIEKGDNERRQKVKGWFQLWLRKKKEKKIKKKETCWVRCGGMGKIKFIKI